MTILDWSQIGFLIVVIIIGLGGLIKAIFINKKND